MNIKKIMLLQMIIVFMIAAANSQPPQSFNYQAAIRDNSGNLVKNQEIGIQIKVLSGSPTGTAIYTEAHEVISNDYGIVTLEIGKGTTTDNFSTINWGNDTYYMQVAIDMEGGTNYVVMGTSQFLTVPYALYANEADYLDGKQAIDFSSATHTHSRLPAAYGYISQYSIGTTNCVNVESVAWSDTYSRFEIKITDINYSIDDMTVATLIGDAGSCPAGATIRTSSVSGYLLVYIVNSSAEKIKCSFDFVSYAD